MVNKTCPEQNTYIRQILSSILLGLVLAYVCAFLILPIESWIRVGLDMDTFSRSLHFWKEAAIHPHAIFLAYHRWWHLFTNMDSVPLSFYLPFLPLCVFFMVLIFKIRQSLSVMNAQKKGKNHYSKIKTQKNKTKRTRATAMTGVKKVKRKYYKKIREK